MAHRWRGGRHATLWLTIDGEVAGTESSVGAGSGIDGLLPAGADELGLRSSAEVERQGAVLF